ncbi:MAG: tRNA (adenosine(37)-N6)-threonylcarbamoyltransferase complex ATPase subunit type 1 TsaE [Deltaproteobacteria bacterium]|nr:tRNA (adenosine(37)-N6)-threonylcarbamoyltransferase complex ATPase subunit type 1 TsaE [Deltaproteobacteria bacterium]
MESDKQRQCVTHCEDETYALGRRLAENCRGGELLGLRGELGAGKTALVRGLAAGLGVDPDRVRSPSFTLVNEYRGGRLPLYHIDLFRLAPGELDRLALREYLYGEGVCAVEWFERLGEPLQDYIEITLTFVDEQQRHIVAAAHGVGYDPLLRAVSA